MEDVWAKLGPKCLDVSTHLMVIDSRVDNIIAKVRIVIDYSRIVGIQGMGE
jgi:hypothetical protein